MAPREVAQLHGAVRAALGAVLMAAPRLVGRSWVGSDARRASVQVYSGALGARDLGIGVGQLAVARSGQDVGPWIAAGMLADAADFAMTLRHRAALPAFGAASVALMAGGSVVVGAWLWRALAAAPAPPQAAP